MTTKDRCLSLKPDKQKTFVNSVSTDNHRFTNLNLNDSHFCSSFSENSTKSKCNLLNTKKVVNDYGNPNDISDPKDVNCLKRQKPSEYLNLCETEENRKANKAWKKKDSNAKKNSSTLSLHIAAYENAVEASGQPKFDLLTAIESKDASLKVLKDVKHLSIDDSLKDSLEFPRQQQDTVMEPEVMQFRASQKLFNPNDEADKENFPSGSQILPNSAPILTREQRKERMPLKDTITYICEKIENLKRILTEEESAQKLQVTVKDFVQICRFIDGIFINFELGRDFDDEEIIRVYQTQANVAVNFVGLIEKKLPQEVIIWIISVFIDLVSNRPFGDRLSGQLMDNIFTFSKYLSDPFREKLVAEIIDQWMELLSGSTVFCLNEQMMKHFHDGKDGFDLFPVKIQVKEDDTEKKACVLRCILHYFLYSTFDFETLHGEKLASLYLCMIKDVFDFRISNLIIQLFHKLIGADLCNGIFLMHIIDIVFSFLDCFHREQIPAGSLEARQKSLIESAIKSCLDKIASNIILPSTLKQMALCKPSTFLPYAARGIDLLLTFNLNNPTILKFVVNSLKNLADSDCLGDFIGLPDTCKKLLRFLIIQREVKKDDIEFISELFSFVIKFKGDDNTSKLIDNLLQSASESGKKTTVYINVRQTLISVLSPLPNAKQILTKVVPCEDEIIQLFEDLKNPKFDDSTYLTASFNIIAKSADFYNGNADTLLSFLSLPWICDIGWQIWEDFKKALPLLVPIKTNEDNYKAILSTSSLKSVSLKALSQIPSNNQWRSFIVKEALYSTDFKVKIAVLDALPYLLTTIKTYSFFEVLAPLIETLSKADQISASFDLLSTVESLIRSISLCICVSGNQYKILPDKQMCCNLCQTKEGNRRSIRITFPPATLELFGKIVAIEEEENELKIHFINLLSATVRHISVSDELVENLITISLPLINGGSGIAISYLDFIEESIKSSLSETVIRKLHEQIYYLQDQLLQLDYFVVCALNSAKPDFAFNCILEVIGKSTVRASKSSKAVEKAVAMVKVLADREKISPRTYFIRNCAKLCEYIIKRLLNSLAQITSNENISEDEHKIGCDSVIEACFASMAYVFDISTKKTAEELSRDFLSFAVDFLLPPLFSFKSSSNMKTSANMNQFQYFDIILVKICETLNCLRYTAVTNALPRMIWFLCYFRNLPWSNHYFHRVEAYSHGFIASMIKLNYCKCSFSAILGLGKNEEAAKVYLSKIYTAHNDKAPEDFTTSIRLNYLGILLELRRTFSEDMYYHQRLDIIKSLVVLINNLDRTFFSLTPGRMLTVLKAIVPVENSFDAWMAFLQKLDPEVLEKQIHHVLIAASSLINLPGAKRIFEYILNVRKKADPSKSSCQRFDRAVLVLYAHEKQFMLDSCDSVVKDEPPLFSCAKMLLEEAPDVHFLVLEKILQMLETEKIKFEILDELIHALLHALKTSTASKTRQIIGICIGKIGAIDPGKIGVAAIGDNSKPIDRRSLPLKFVDKMNEFFEEILEICAKLLVECSDATKVDFIAMAIQQILRELSCDEMKNEKTKVLDALKEETKNEISPYWNSKFKFTIKDGPPTNDRPYADHAAGYTDWLWRWYFAACEKLRDQKMGRIFRAIQHFYYSGDSRIVQPMLCQVILQSLLEDNQSITDEACAEIFGVFKKALASGEGWIRMAAQTCFQIIEFLEKFDVERSKSSSKYSRRPANAGMERVQKFLTKTVGERHEGTGELLSVAVAEKYNFACRALRWLEQYGIKVAPSGIVEFNRTAMYALERIYLQLSDTDGVLGAYETIQNSITPSPQERVVAFEATGDHTEALPLYQQKPVQKLPLVKCLLRLNQPLIAFNLAGSFAKEEENEKVKYKLRDYQIEAAYRREEWQNLGEILKDTTEKSNQITTWGAHVASIFAGIHDKSKEVFEGRIQNARMQVMDSLKAVTMEGADTYSQAYRYIQRLHILYEIEDAAGTMKLFNPPSVSNCKKLIEKWDTRSDNAIQCSSILEPIYWVRRELLSFADPVKNKDKISHYLIESCKLSRQANHISTSWAHLIHARSLGVEKDLYIDMEEARYFFQRGQKGEAICSLQKTLEKHFPRLVEKLKTFTSKNATEAGKAAKKVADEMKLSKEDKADYVNTQLQLTTYMDKSNASNIGDIYIQYAFMEGLAEKNEQQAYCFAVFYDNAYYCRSPENSENVLTCVRLYARVLTFGRRYLLHVMPRMLTVWLDFATAMHEKAVEAGPVAKKGRRTGPTKVESQQVTDFICDEFGIRIEPFYFFTAFPQLISRLCHPVETVFKALEKIICELMILYPHECLWQIIASYRSDQKTDKLRYDRTRQLVKTASNKAKSAKPHLDLQKLADNYATLAELFIKLAEWGDDRTPVGEFNDFNKTFKAFNEFFKKPGVKIAVPFITMVEKKMPTFFASQISMPDHDDTTVYIKGIEDKYKIFSSMEKPKLITIIGTNGVRYQMIAKKGDEMRKDARCLDFCRMVNTLLLRDSEARRRQLHIRTYSVIPLQARGGLIEVVPNLTHLRAAFASTSNESDTAARWKQIQFDKVKRQKFYDEIVGRNPVKMAEYLRKTFVDPCKWYSARLAFTRTAATMSMVGFILGLGDRHCENILLDFTNGDVVHVDFNILFNKGEDLPCPELVPFRLTRNMIDGFGPTGVEGAFRKTCETVMRVLRQEQATLCTVLETFVHDPLLEWAKIDNRNHQIRGTVAPKAAVDVDNHEVAISLIKARLEGKIVTKKIYPLTKSCIPMSVEGQVAQLIKMAKDRSILGLMYIGWNPHL